MWKVELSLFFIEGCKKTILVFALHGQCCQFTPMTSEDTTEAGSVHHLNGAWPVHCNTEHVSRGEAALNDPDKFVWCNCAVVNVHTVALKQPWFHTCNKYKHTQLLKNTCGFKAILWLTGISGLICVFCKGSVKLKTMPEGNVNTNFSCHLHSDSRHLGGSLTSVLWVQNNKMDSRVNPTGTPSSCIKMATVQIQRCKRRVKVHIYILYIEHSWANSHIVVVWKRNIVLLQSKIIQKQTKKDELFTKWRHKNISKHHLDLCAIRVFVSISFI